MNFNRDINQISKVSTDTKNLETKESKRFLVWKSVEIDSKTIDEIKKKLEEKGVHIDGTVSKILKTSSQEAPRTVNLVKITPKDLGLEGHNIGYIEIQDAASELGLTGCSTRSVLEARLVYTDQSEDEILHVHGVYGIDRTGNADDAILYLSNHKGTLSVRTEDLSDYDGAPNTFISTDKFLFEIEK